MKQTILIVLTVVGICSCASTEKVTEKKLLGSWDNKNGQILQFMPDGNAFWIFYTGTKRDTFNIQYNTDFSKTPPQLDLTDFKTGPLTGKTLYGIVEFTKPREIKFDCEPSKENRPKEFNLQQTQVYYKTGK
jgi:hypothetical protein